ncbi:MAG: hypothetical protein ACRQFF_04725 [Sphaerochaeta sp.]
MKTKIKITLLLILLSTFAGAIFAETTNFYSDVSLDSSGIDGASVNGNLIELPIIATYDPQIDTTFSIYADSGSEVDIYGTYGTTNLTSYNTDYYDITSEENSESFSLNYIANEDESQIFYIYIYYFPEWYSVEDYYKYTGQTIDLSYTLMSDDDFSISHYSSGSGGFYNIDNYDIFDYDYFKFIPFSGYINSTILKFKFTWDAKTLEEINSSSYSNFSAGEKVKSKAVIQIVAE